MKSALVTGANGHIGCHVVRSLLDAGVQVTALVRRGSDRRGLAGLAVELREGDLLDEDSILRAAAGVDVLFHVGAAHRNFARSPDDILRPAIEGTRNMLSAAIKAGVRRVVYTSSGATVGFTATPARPLDETSLLATAESPYTRAKIEAEALVREHAGTGRGPEVVIVNPSGVFGPLDYRLTPSTRALIGLAQGDPSFLTVSVTDVRDVGRAHVLAAERGAAGERYLITGDVLSPGAVAEAVGAVTGRAPKEMTPPRFLMLLLSWLAVRKARRLGTDAPITPEIVRDVYGRHLAYDGSRSRRELGMSYRPALEVLTDAYRWLLFLDALTPKVAARVRAALGDRAAPDPGWAAAAAGGESPPTSQRIVSSTSAP
ncbi:MAG: NAD-dependent epimerase/dehydratase family protein [Byssovorax sp.]